MYPSREFHFWVYIMASRSLQLYIGMTNSLRRRVAEHKAHLPGSHTARYNIDRLVYCEHFQSVNKAIAREKELKDWNRAKKLALIRESNPTWLELSEEGDMQIPPLRYGMTNRSESVKPGCPTSRF